MELKGDVWQVSIRGVGARSFWPVRLMEMKLHVFLSIFTVTFLLDAYSPYSEKIGGEIIRLRTCVCGSQNDSVAPKALRTI